MSIIKLTKKDAEHAVYGGCILGGGGGGWIADGLQKAADVFEIGEPTLVPADALDEDDLVACVALVGAPSAPNIYIDSDQLIQSVLHMQEQSEQPIKALMTNENGASTTINGWLQSAATGLPFIDAPCNGRAHPTGAMGSLNLTEDPSYISIQTFAGGKGTQEMNGVLTGALDATSDAVRAISMHAGGMVGVCRNPVSVSYVKEHAAVGGISDAIELGRVFLTEPAGEKRVETVASFLGGKIIGQGIVDQFDLKESGGYDVGLLHVDGLELTVWNEYMTAEKNGERLGTFPDLLMTFMTATGMPIVSAEIEQGMDITVIYVPKENLKLSSTMANERLLKEIEPIIQRTIV